MTNAPASRRRSGEKKDSTPLEEDWIRVARQALIEEGVSAIQINALAARLGVTRGGFYWRFRNRQDLLDQLIQEWQQSNTRRFVQALQRPGTGPERYKRIMRLVEKGEFDAVLDAAVRQWGKIDREVAAKVRDADLQRIQALQTMFEEAGQSPDEALIRARIVYYHQIGFDAVGLNEAPSGRKDLVAAYHHMLNGF